MTRRILTLVVGLAVAAVVALAAEQVSDEQRLQAAIRAEVISDDLQTAIREYKILSESADPTVAARARTRLAAVMARLGPSPAGGGELSIERVWAGADVNVSGQLSADGRLLTHVDPAGNLAVRDLTSGTSRRLTNDASVLNFAGQSILSPDARLVAYRWGDEDPSIRIISASGGEPRTLVRDNHELWLEAWSPDGATIAAVRTRSDETSAIVLLSMADGFETQLTSTGWRAPMVGGFSKDGRSLLYALGPGRGAQTGGVFLIAVDGSTDPVPLVTAEASFSSPIWTPDFGHVVFVSDRSGQRDLWVVPVAGGRARGEPMALRRNWTGSLKRVASDGSLYYAETQNEDAEAYIAAFDTSTLTISNVEPVTRGFVGRNRQPEVSPDGRSAAFMRVAGDERTVVVKNLVTGDERSVASLAGGAYGSRGPMWFPDSRALLLFDKPNDLQQARFRKVDVESGREQPLFLAPWETWTTVALSPDGRSVYYSVREGDEVSLVRRELDSTTQQELYRTTTDGAGLFGLSVSPNGRQLAFLINRGVGRILMLLPSTGGVPAELIRGDFDQILPHGAVAWTPDGRHLVVTTSPSGSNGMRQLAALPVEGGSLKLLGVEMNEIRSRAVSADGTRIAFTGAGGQTRELWVMRGMLSLLPKPDGF